MSNSLGSADTVLWEVVAVGVRISDKGGLPTLVGLLEQGWEPFAVTQSGNVYDYHLRRQVERP